jgi:hypothetical protein
MAKIMEITNYLKCVKWLLVTRCAIIMRIANCKPNFQIDLKRNDACFQYMMKAKIVMPAFLERIRWKISTLLNNFLILHNELGLYRSRLCWYHAKLIDGKLTRFLVWQMRTKSTWLFDEITRKNGKISERLVIPNPHIFKWVEPALVRWFWILNKEYKCWIEVENFEIQHFLK